MQTHFTDPSHARYLTQEEIDRGYEVETGKLIIETFEERGLDILAVPGVLLHGHGPLLGAKMQNPP